MKKILKVISCGDVFDVKSEKSETGAMHKRIVVLQEIGGKFENTYVAARLGKDALCQFYAGDLVVAALRFSAREYNGQMFQDIVVSEIIKLNK